ncbi:MAG: hypothetical protein ACKUBY_00460 [Candidatus Moraniibacteriota bacterium]|jgi:hypothetical protein
MDYEKLAQKIYEGIHKKHTFKASQIFTAAEVQSLRREGIKQKFVGDQIIFASKLVYDNFVVTSFSERHMLILKENLSKKEYNEFCKKISNSEHLSDAVKFCINLYNLIFTEEVP